MDKQSLCVFGTNIKTNIYGQKELILRGQVQINVLKLFLSTQSGSLTSLTSCRVCTLQYVGLDGKN